MDFIVSKKEGKLYSEPTRIFSNPEDLKAILNPIRWKILQMLTKEANYPAQIAKELKMHEQKVYYHIKQLRNAGLLTLVRTEEKKGALARYFRAEKTSFSLKGGDWDEKHNLFERHLEHGIEQFMSPFIEKGKLNCLVVVGSPDAHGPFKARARDNHYAVDLGVWLGFLSEKLEGMSVRLDTEIKESELKKNLIIVGGPITNRILEKVNEASPVRINTKDKYASTIMSEISGNKYPDRECGFISKIENPWNKDSRIMLLAGRRYLGTKAAIVALTEHIEEVAKLNSFDRKTPSKIVRGLDIDGDGQIDDVEFLE